MAEAAESCGAVRAVEGKQKNAHHLVIKPVLLNEWAASLSIIRTWSEVKEDPSKRRCRKKKKKWWILHVVVQRACVRVLRAYSDGWSSLGTCESWIQWKCSSRRPIIISLKTKSICMLSSSNTEVYIITLYRCVNVQFAMKWRAERNEQYAQQQIYQITDYKQMFWTLKHIEKFFFLSAVPFGLYLCLLAIAGDSVGVCLCVCHMCGRVCIGPKNFIREYIRIECGK